MREFFRGWKRKLGVPTLVLTCVFAAGWVRTAFYADALTFSMDGRTHRVVSAFDGFGWISIDVAPSSSRWDTIPANEFAQSVTNNSLAEMFDDVFKGQVAAGRHPWGFCLFYSRLVLPLAILSAYLLLHNPRSAKGPDQST